MILSFSTMCLDCMFVKVHMYVSQHTYIRIHNYVPLRMHYIILHIIGTSLLTVKMLFPVAIATLYVAML